VRFQALTAASMKMRAFSDIAPRSDKPWWWRQYAPLKRQSTLRLHDAIYQKALIFVSMIFKLIFNMPAGLAYFKK
jgi:hypothetical protein